MPGTKSVRSIKLKSGVILKGTQTSSFLDSSNNRARGGARNSSSSLTVPAATFTVAQSLIGHRIRFNCKEASTDRSSSTSRVVKRAINPHHRHHYHLTSIILQRSRFGGKFERVVGAGGPPEVIQLHKPVLQRADRSPVG